MKLLIKIIIPLLILISCYDQEKVSVPTNPINSIRNKSNPPKLSEEENNGFKFIYVNAGLGSGMGAKGPKFKVNGNKFLFTSEQNSSRTGKFDNSIDTICLGEIRLSSIDSIKEITNQISQSKIQDVNPLIMSGGIYNIEISFEQKNIEFSLINISHPLAKDIVQIINSNIPPKCGKLSLYESLEEKSKNNNDTIHIKIPDSLQYSGYSWAY